MGDRRPSFFRSLLSSATASRRQPAEATKTAESNTGGQSTTAVPSRPATTRPPSNAEKADQTQLTPSPSKMATKNNQSPKSSPSSQSRSMPQSKSPSKSPPQSASPSKPSPRARPTPSSPSRPPSSQTPSTPKRAPQPRSPKQTSPNSSKAVKPSSPTKESTKEEIATSHEAPTSTSQNEGTKVAPLETEEGSQPKADIKADNGKGLDDIQTEPSNLPAPNLATTTPTEESESPTISKDHKPSMEEIRDKAEEIKEVKEVVHEPENESNGESKKEMNDPLPPKSFLAEEIIEKNEVPEPDKLQIEMNRDTKEAAFSVPPNEKSAHSAHEPKKSRIGATQNKSTVPGGEHAALPNDIMGDISTFVNRMPVGDSKGAVSIITLAGENRGASMQMGSNSSQAEGPVHIHRGYKMNPDESADAMSDREGKFEGMKSGDEKEGEDQSETYVNNNAQGINNSIVFNSCITERNPGVHMVFTHISKEAIQATGKTSPMTRKAEFNMAEAERHTYEPSIRRRCLRGLLLESSDSDTDNPEKPRRHGCRVGCQQQQADKGDNDNVTST